MKLVNKRTRKAINKTVRKALRKNGPAIMAGLASAIAASLATLAEAEEPGKGGKSKLLDLAERVKETVGGDHKKAMRKAEKKRERQEAQRAH